MTPGNETSSKDGNVKGKVDREILSKMKQADHRKQGNPDGG